MKSIKALNHPDYLWSTLWPLEVWVRGLYNSWWFCVHKLPMFIYNLSMVEILPAREAFVFIIIFVLLRKETWFPSPTFYISVLYFILYLIILQFSCLNYLNTWILNSAGQDWKVQKFSLFSLFYTFHLNYAQKFNHF